MCNDTGMTRGQGRKHITIAAPGEVTILAARYLDTTEGPVQVGSIVDASTRSAITTVLRYITTAHNSPVAKEWTPPPPGDTREQLPDHILELIRSYLRPYTASACETAYAITRRLRDAFGNTDDDVAELSAWRERLWKRCRENQKFTGQRCVASHHDWPPGLNTDGSASV